MKRHSKAVGKAVRAERRKAATPKRSSPAKAVSGRPSPATGRETKTARLTRERDEALEQLSAATDVLKVISSSPAALQTVFQTILENATRICEAKFGVLYRFDGRAFHFAAEVGSPAEYVEFNRRRGAFHPVPGAPLE